MKRPVVFAIVVVASVPIAMVVYQETNASAEAEARASIMAGLDADEAAIRARLEAARSARATAQREASVLDDQVKSLTLAITELDRATNTANAAASAHDAGVTDDADAVDDGAVDAGAVKAGQVDAGDAGVPHGVRDD